MLRRMEVEDIQAVEQIDVVGVDLAREMKGPEDRSQ